MDVDVDGWMWVGGWMWVWMGGCGWAESVKISRRQALLTFFTVKNYISPIAIALAQELFRVHCYLSN
jgi:hypothetical protein